ncbi:Uma2 family endonuclease [Sporichthya polymorpha]|uniref:Uma2 family endonuclease n=1 Tax=Sporichthya polymorpha TaxID=35751 RepID=UPI0003651FDE|nr:Uma2 family endonuclease [Sporichthya polymorpha]
MTDQFTALRSRPLTVADLESMPDDGRRYELIDGMLLVNPSPTHAHQRMLFRLGMALHAACPPELEVVIAPFDVQSATDSVVQPDVLVARRSDIGERNLTVAPLMAAEVLSRSTSLYDRNLKKAHYARIGVSSYWLLDPSVPGAIEVFTLDAGSYRLVAAAVGEEQIDVEAPYPVTLSPAALLA